MGTEILHQGEDILVDSIVSAPKEDAATAYGYGVNIQASPKFHTGGAAIKRYLLNIDASFASGGVAHTGDSNGAAIKVGGSNYVAHDANYIYRGINIGYNNSSGGSMGRMENSLGVQNKSGGTVPILLACTFTMENYGTCATESGAADFITRNEANTATLSYGIRIRNDDRSGQPAVQSAINITSHASSGGFRELIDASGAVLTEYDTGTKVVLMKFQGADGTTYYLVHDTDAATVLSVATSVS